MSMLPVNKEQIIALLQQSLQKAIEDAHAKGFKDFDGKIEGNALQLIFRNFDKTLKDMGINTNIKIIGNRISVEVSVDDFFRLLGMPDFKNYIIKTQKNGNYTDLILEIPIQL